MSGAPLRPVQGLAGGLAGALALAASPTFAAMAAVTAVAGGPDLLCLAGASPLAGMTVMYALMSAFHAGAWLRLLPVAGGRGTA